MIIEKKRHDFGGLPIAPTAAGGPLRVCVVSPEFVGPSRNGGIGTAYTALAVALSAAGHLVTCLYTGASECTSDQLKKWVAEYKANGLILVPLPKPSVHIDALPYSAKSYDVYHWLKVNDIFDYIHFPDWQGLGYHATLAKRQGLALLRSTLCVGLHSMNQWLKFANREYIGTVTELEQDFVERQAVALADVVISPSRYLLQWASEQNWTLPEASYVQQNIMPKTARQALTDNPQARQISEIVFFGRLETRKGVLLFCDALDALPASLASGIKRICFLGKSAVVEGQAGESFVRRRAERWQWNVDVITDCNQPEAMKYLAEPGRLAVIPSLIENSPYTVLECLGAGIAFLASRVGGIPELILEEDTRLVCFEPTARSLLSRLTAVLTDGYVAARPSIEFGANERCWIKWHETANRSSLSNPGVELCHIEPNAWPRVSLCITTYNRPGLLMQALESVMAIVYPNLEVVLVDDGSTDAEALELLLRIEPEFCRRGWKIVRQSNLYLGAARNTGARNATGDFFLFMDDDNFAEPSEVATLVAVALRTGADITCCGMNYFSGQERPNTAAAPQGRWLPVGPAASLGAFCNTFGDANALVRRSCFEAVGGFTEDYGVTHEDWEFHAKAVLQGAKLQVVPEFLFWYRVNPGSMIRTLPKYPNFMRSIRPYLDAVPDQLRSLVLFAQGEYMRQVQVANELTPYAKLTIQWKAKLEAGLALAGLKQDGAAAKMMLSGVSAVEKCPLPRVIVEALLEISPHLAKLDSSRAGYLLGIAVKYTEALGWTPEQERAKALLASIARPHASQSAKARAPISATA